MSSPILLCIDDRADVLQVRKSSLEALGYSIITATGSATAVALLEQIRVAAVLMQYKSEGIDAEAVAFQIKQRFPQQPIILLSGYSDMPERVLWLVDDYIANSEYPQRLKHIVERLTGLVRRQRQMSDHRGEAA